jgi:hypothetical protein
MSNKSDFSARKQWLVSRVDGGDLHVFRGNLFEMNDHIRRRHIKSGIQYAAHEDVRGG